MNQSIKKINSRSIKALILIMAAMIIASLMAGSGAAQNLNTDAADKTETTENKNTGDDAPARTGEAAKDIPPMVVVGEPETTNSVSLDDIEKMQPSNLYELFGRSPSVNIGGGTVQSQKIYIRNMEDTTMNVTVDGAQQSGNLFHHQGRISIDPELLKRAEVSSGMSGAALNGPGALSGAVRFETKSAFDLLEPGQQWGARAKVNYYTNAEGLRFSGSAFGMISDTFGILAAGSHTDRDDYENGDGETIDNSGYDRVSGLVKISGQLGDHHYLDLGYEGIQDETVGFLRLNFGDFSRAGTLKNYEIGRDTASLNYSYQPDSDRIDFKSTLYYTEHEVVYEEVEAATESLIGSGVNAFGIDLRNTSRFSRFSVTYGTDLRIDEGYIVNRHLGGPGVQTGQDEETRVLGLYAQGELPVYRDRVTLSAGARFDHYDYEDHLGQSFDSTGLSPNIGIKVRPLDGLTLSAGYARAFRGVGMPEVMLIGPARGVGTDVAVINAQDIDPEEAENFELRADYQGRYIYANAAVFRQTIDDYIAPTTTASGFRDNIGDFENTGYEIMVGSRINGFHLAVGVADSNPELNGEPTDSVLGLATTTGRRWTAYVDYHHAPLDITTGWDIQHLEETESLQDRSFGADGTFTKASYTVHNIFVRWEPGFADGLSLALNVNNLFDENYIDQYVNSYSFGYAFDSPGRELTFTLAYKF